MDRLLVDGADVTLLVRSATSKGEAVRFERWREDARWRGARLRLLPGDVTEPALGLGAAELEELDVASLDRVFHVAGYYDLLGDPAAMASINVDG